MNTRQDAPVPETDNPDHDEQAYLARAYGKKVIEFDVGEQTWTRLIRASIALGSSPTEIMLRGIDVALSAYETAAARENYESASRDLHDIAAA